MKFTRVFAFMALAGLAGSAFATNGMFSHGYGMKSKGMAGASSAMSDDAFAGANNPAAAAFAGDRIDLGVDLFSPRREASMDNWGGSGMNVSEDSESNYFLIPEFGYNSMISDSMAWGVTVYGNGGMNTDYPEVVPGTNFYGGSGNLGVDLIQLVIAPTFAFKVAPNHSLGISPLIGYQRFTADGFPAGANGPISDSTDDAWGFGVRVGYMGKLTPDWTIGAAYASKIDFQEFDKYNNLFLDQGDLDLAENWNLGVAWQATPEIKLALDYQQINYSGVTAIGTPAMQGGFGWDDAKVWKLGAEYKLSQQMTLRAGYSHTNSPIEGADAAACGAGSDNCMEVTQNIVAPGVIEDHLTLGMTYTLESGDEMTFAYMHGFENEVSGYDALSTGTDTIKMYQNSFGFQYSWKM